MKFDILFSLDVMQVDSTSLIAIVSLTVGVFNSLV